MKKIKIGLLPFYIKLYDTSNPDARPVVQKFACDIAVKFATYGAEIVTSPICCVKDEFESALNDFKKEGIDVLVTLHLAYSPSLESAEVLSKCEFPLIVLDTTPNYVFNESITSDAIMYNHGIHGVQDMCNLLKRNGKKFEIFAGHYLKSDVCKKVVDCARAIAAAKSLVGSKVGFIGKLFEGMGDFLASEDAMQKLGITALHPNGNELESCVKAVTSSEIAVEYEKDKALCKTDGITIDTYQNTERVALGVRKWLKKQGVDAFTMNFQSAGELKGFDTMPFSEASKQMSTGIGYAGEGDVLTAAFVGSFVKYFEEVTFAEMFCPNWQGGSVYLSHMGEANLRILENKKMIIKDFPYAEAFNPTCITGYMKGGKACFVNIAPNGEGYFEITVAEGNMLSVPNDKNDFRNSMNGWFKPDCSLESFLENYSRFGGTHHGMIIYGVDSDIIKAYADGLNMDCHIIKR